ncbi:hypothetical protein AB5I41_16110 [Sphingomonas sp. MMS24-JH45]
MVLRADIVSRAVDAVADGRPVLAMTPRGAPLTQGRVRALAAGARGDRAVRAVEGFDERLFEGRRYGGRTIEEVAIGDYVLSGGEMGALVLLDALRSPASRRNGRRFQRGRGKLRKRPSRISALYPTI